VERASDRSHASPVGSIDRTARSCYLILQFSQVSKSASRTCFLSSFLQGRNCSDYSDKTKGPQGRLFTAAATSRHHRFHKSGATWEVPITIRAPAPPCRVSESPFHMERGSRRRPCRRTTPTVISTIVCSLLRRGWTRPAERIESGHRSGTSMMLTLASWCASRGWARHQIAYKSTLCSYTERLPCSFSITHIVNTHSATLLVSLEARSYCWYHVYDNPPLRPGGSGSCCQRRCCSSSQPAQSDCSRVWGWVWCWSWEWVWERA